MLWSSSECHWNDCQEMSSRRKGGSEGETHGISVGVSGFETGSGMPMSVGVAMLGGLVRRNTNLGVLFLCSNGEQWRVFSKLSVWLRGCRVRPGPECLKSNCCVRTTTAVSEGG